MGAALGADPLRFVLGGGDDHALAATFPTAEVPAGWTAVGEVLDAGEAAEHLVTVDGAAYDGVAGYRHF